MRIQIIYEDKDVLVIYKPAGLATQTSRVGQVDVMSECKNYLARQRKEASGGAEPYIGVVHRLDQPVEGLLVFAKNKNAAATLASQVGTTGDKQFNKQYYAVICGNPVRKEGELVDHLAKEGDNKAVVCEKGGKRAKLQFRQVSEAVLPGGETLSLMDISIFTGRFHQIRAQMSHAGMPLLGDMKYGDEKTISLSHKLGVRNVALCAYSLAFVHPVTDQIKNFQIQPEGIVFSYFKRFS